MTLKSMSGILTAAIIVGLASCAGAHDMADRIFIHGKIWTVNPARPWAEAIAVRDGRVLSLGTTGEVRALAGPKTEVIDLRGAFVLPGFIDSHVHFVNGGFSLMSIQLRDASTKDEFVRRVADKAKSLPSGEWILNGDWDHENFRPVELPRKDWIDAVTPHHPVCINRLDEHMILANSLALKIAGITKATPVPAGGEIVKDAATGEPTGILKDAAMDLVYAKIPDATPAQNRRAVEAAMSYAAAHGVTSVHDVSGEVGLDIYQDLLKEGNLKTRICFYMPITSLDQVAGVKLKTGFGNEFLKFGGLKGFADGSLGSATAYFFEPFTDNPATHGLLHAQMFPEGVMETRVRTADRAGLQTAIHAIGDRANAMILDIYERVAAADGARDRRFRIEHAQHVRPDDIARFGRLGVIASVQPYHLIDDGRWAEKKIGSDRMKSTYPFKSFLDRGVRLACGSDWPVAPMDPILGIYAAVTRRTLDDKHPDGWVPEQKISLEEAIRGFTWNGAYAEFAESVKGSLEPGKLADLVVLDRDLFSLRPEELKTAIVRMTVCGGRVIFSK